MEDSLYYEVVEYWNRRKIPGRLTGNDRGNFIKRCKLYTVDEVDRAKLLYQRKPVIRYSQLREEVEALHGSLQLAEHRMGVRTIELRLRERWSCIGLRKILLKMCETSCSRCLLTASGTQWFARTIKGLSPVTETIAKAICEKLGIAFQELPPIVAVKKPFKRPVNLEAVEPDGNCVFRVLARAVGAIEEDHAQLRKAVLDHMEKQEVIMGLRNIYGQAELDRCIAHRSSEREPNVPVCGLVISAAAHLLGIDILQYWKSVDGVQEWSLMLASMKSKVWAEHQIAMRYLEGVSEDHADLVLSFK